MSKKQLSPPSDEFKSAVLDTSSLVVDCQFCGRTHFTDEFPNELGESELKQLMKQHKKDPDKYVLHEDCVKWGMMDGKQAVVDCQCNYLAKYECFIWHHRYVISEYLLERTKNNKDIADRESKLVEKVNSSINLSK
ncbi:hypothetical protein KAT24_01820 [Candidatus Pacearchaeota archaeon]|nr:hypothetical protein [Candidatus Pacearchaeota archaeon]